MRHCAFLCVALLLSGCAAVGRVLPEALRPAPASATEPQKTANELVAYLARLRGLNERGLAAEAARQRQMARSEPSDLAAELTELRRSIDRIASRLEGTTEAGEG